MARNYAVETVSSLPFGMLIGAPLMAGIEAQTQAAKATIDFILQVGFLPSTAIDAQGNLVADPNLPDVTEPDGVPVENTNPSTNAGQTRMVTFSYTTNNEDPGAAAVLAAAQAAAKGGADGAAAVAAVKNVPGVTKLMVDAATAAQDAGGDQNAVAAALVPSTTKQIATITVPILSVVPIPFFSIDEMTIDFVAKITEAITASSKAAKQIATSASTQARGGWGPVSGGFKAGLSSTHTSTSERSSKYQTELTMTIHVRASSESMPKGMAKVLDMLAGLIKGERA